MVQIVDIPVVKQGSDLDGSDQIEGQAAAGGTGSSFRTSLDSLTSHVGESVEIPMDQVTGLVDDQTRQDDALDDHETANDPHPQYLTPQELPQTTVVYMSAAVHPVYPADYSMTLTTPTNPEAAIVTSVGADDVLCASFVRDPALSQDVLYAELEARVVLDLGGEAESTFVYVTATLRKGDASPDVPLGTSTPLMLEANRGTYVFTVQILGPVSAVAGDYTVIELYGTKDGGGSARTVTVYVDGNGVSRSITNIPIPAYPAAHALTHEKGGTDELALYHTDLLGRYADNQHRITNITDLSDELEAKTYAAYIAMRSPVNQATVDLGAGWVDLAGLSVSTPPLHFTDGGNGQFITEYSSVYFLSLSGAFEHNSDGSGRITYVRLYNHTDGVAGDAVAIGTGRNAEATSIPVSAMIEIPIVDIGKSFGFQIGGGDTYTSVVINTLGYSLHNAGLVVTDYT